MIGNMLQTTISCKKYPLSNRRKDMVFKRARIVACKPRPNYRVWIRFDDGLEGEVNLSHLVGKGGGASAIEMKAFETVGHIEQYSNREERVMRRIISATIISPAGKRVRVDEPRMNVLQLPVFSLAPSL